MTYKTLRQTIRNNIFTFTDVRKSFPVANKSSLYKQMHRLVKSGSLIRLRKGVYCFWQTQIDPYEVMSILYPDCYVSLESRMLRAGLLDPTFNKIQEINLVSNVHSLKELILVNNSYFKVSISKVNPRLFTGFKKVFSEKLRTYYFEATIEKAILDWIYLRRPNCEQVDTLNFSKMASKFYTIRFDRLQELFPKFVQNYIIF